MASKRTKQGAAPAVPTPLLTPYDAPELLHIEIRMVVLENGAVAVEPAICLRRGDPRHDDLLATYAPVVRERVIALGNELSRMVTGATEDPTEVLLGPPAPRAAPAQIVKLDRRGGRA